MDAENHLSPPVNGKYFFLATGRNIGVKFILKKGMSLNAYQRLRKNLDYDAKGRKLMEDAVKAVKELLEFLDYRHEKEG